MLINTPVTAINWFITPIVDEISGGEISATNKGDSVAYAPIHNPIQNLPIIKAKKLNTRVSDVAEIIIIARTMSAFLLPYLRNGETNNDPKIAPNGIKSN